jgi:carboxylesterase type B
MYRLLSLFAALNVLLALTLAQDPGLTVQTQEGAVSGSLVLPTVRRFLGIPYATANRWQAPASPPSRNATLDATQFGDSCPQRADRSAITLGGLIGSSAAAVSESDDCLTLNIWSPSTSRKQSTAVLLWIYGGAYQFGTVSLSIRHRDEICEYSQVKSLSDQYCLL